MRISCWTFSMGTPAMGESRNPKAENRRKPENRGPKPPTPSPRRKPISPEFPGPSALAPERTALSNRSLASSDFGFRPSFGLRSSVFGFRIRFPLATSKPLLALYLLLLLATTLRAADSTGDAVECANLIYSGTKSSVCFSEEFLSTVASETSINTSRKFKAVKLGEREVFRFPFAVMTGEGAFTLTDNERKNLKLYLEKGGFLLASAGCSSKEWGDSFTREMKAIFPERKLEDVPLTHSIFRTLFDIPRLDTKAEDAKLFGLTIAGKIVVIYSPDGLNDTATMHGCCCCGGNEIKNSQKVNANILVYALLQ